MQPTCCCEAHTHPANEENTPALQRPELCRSPYVFLAPGRLPIASLPSPIAPCNLPNCTSVVQVISCTEGSYKNTPWREACDMGTYQQNSCASSCRGAAGQVPQVVHGSNCTFEGCVDTAHGQCMRPWTDIPMGFATEGTVYGEGRHCSAIVRLT